MRRARTTAARKASKSPSALRVKRRKRAGRPKKNGNHLDLSRIVQAAWKVVDREGVAALSTRKVAAELNVQSPALYWHIKNKQELLSWMIECVLRKSMRSLPPDLPWWEWLRELAREQHRILLMHRDSGLILSTAPPAEQIGTELMPQAFGPLLRAGLSKQQAAAAIGIIAALVVGCVIFEQNPATRELASAFNDVGQTFESGLDCFILGLRQKVSAPRRS